MPRFLEEKLKQQARKRGFKGKRADAYVYGTMNEIGAMHGNKETAKGAAMEAKHEKDTMKKPAVMKPMMPEGPMRRLEIEIHRGGKNKTVTGHTVHHYMEPRKASKSGAFMENEHHAQPFGPGQHAEMMTHITNALGQAHNMAGEMADQEAAEHEGEGGEEAGE